MTDLFLNLGIDFGTSFTKVCVRDTDRENSWIVTFSNGQTQLNEALLPTKIAIKYDGIILAGLTQSEWEKENQNIEVAIDFIKMRLANLDLDYENHEYKFDRLQTYQRINLNTPESLENLCAFYLSNVIIKSKQWVYENNPNLVKNQDITWSVNVGVPVEYFDSPAIKRFEKVIRLGLLLSENPPKTFKQLWKETAQLREKLDNDHISAFAQPEIAAAVYSYSISRQAKDGMYIFFDIGGGTMEGVAFRFWRQDGSPKIEFYSAKVAPIGVNALVKAIVSHSGLLKSEILNNLIQTDNSLLTEIYSYGETIACQAQVGQYVANSLLCIEHIQANLATTQDIHQQKLLYLMLGQRPIIRTVAEVIVNCRRKKPEDFKKIFRLPVFIGGGGKISSYYTNTIESTHQAFRQDMASIPPYELKDIPFPGGGLTEVEDFSMSGIDNEYFHRFSIAYGLSIPDYNAPEIIGFPRQFAVKTSIPAKQFIPEWGRYPDNHSTM